MFGEASILNVRKRVNLKPIPTMKKGKNNKKLIWILLAVVVVLGAVSMLFGGKKERGTRIAVETTELRTITEEVEASGKIFPKTEVKISSDVSGEIVELLVEEGDSVITGQLLAKVDPDAYQSQVERGRASVNTSKAQLANSRAQVESFQAQIEQIRAQLANAEAVFNRNKKLRDEGVISAAEFEQAESSYRSLQANLRAAEANVRSSEQSVEASKFQVKGAEASLRELQTSLRRTNIYAPIGGIISLLNVERGERVVGSQMMTGTEIMRIANLNVMEVQVEVSENDIPRVSLGDVVDIEVDAYRNRIFKGRVSEVANSAQGMAITSQTGSLTGDQVINFVVTIDIDPSSYNDLITDTKKYPFRPGMSATVAIRTQTIEGVLTVPIQAVTTRKRKKDEARAVTVKSGEANEEDDLMEVVFVVRADTVDMVEVQTGIQNDEFIVVNSGLAAGDQVVKAPYNAVSRKLDAGEKVIVVEEDELYKTND